LEGLPLILIYNNVSFRPASDTPDKLNFLDGVLLKACQGNLKDDIWIMVKLVESNVTVTRQTRKDRPEYMEITQVERVNIPTKDTITSERVGSDKPDQSDTGAMDPVDSELRKYLKPVNFDSDMANYNTEYVPGTRIWATTRIFKWLKGQDENRDSKVLWLPGAAGVGKSIIAWLICTTLPEVLTLGARFFCRHNEPQKSDVVRLVQTLIYQLCETFSTIKSFVSSQLKRTGDTILSNPRDAFRELVIKGLCEVEKQESPKATVIVIDALDECSAGGRSILMNILKDASHELPRFVKIFVTGRPENDILAFWKSMSQFNAGMLEPDKNENLMDVKTYLCYRLSQICPTEENIKGLAEKVLEKAKGTFIYARLACEALKMSVTGQPGSLRTYIETFDTGLDSMYQAIVKMVTRNESQKLEHFNLVMGSILAAKVPLSVETLIEISGVDSTVVTGMVSNLNQLLLTSVDGKLKVVHKSVADFFTDYSRSGPAGYDIDLAFFHRTYLIRMLNVLNTLSFGTQRPASSTTTFFSFAVIQYAAAYWSDHLIAEIENANTATATTQAFTTFVEHHLLEWLLVLQHLGKLKDVVRISTRVMEIADMWDTPPFDRKFKAYVKDMFYDVKRLLQRWTDIIAEDALLFFTLALPSCPTETALGKQYVRDPRIPCFHLRSSKRWDPLLIEINTRVHFSGASLSVELSPDKQWLAICDPKGSLHIWDVKTGLCHVTLTIHTSFQRTIARFSPKGEFLAVNSFADILLWDLKATLKNREGVLLATLKGHTRSERFKIFFAKGGDALITVNGGELLVWDVKKAVADQDLEKECLIVKADLAASEVVLSGREIYLAVCNNERDLFVIDFTKMLKGHIHKSPVKCAEKLNGLVEMATSNDGSLLAVGSKKLLQIFKIDFNSVTLFAPTNEGISKISQDTSEDSSCLKVFEEQFEHDEICHVAFSPTEQVLVSVSNIYSFKFWNVRDPMNIYCINHITTSAGPRGPLSFVDQVTFSPDGLHVVFKYANRGLCTFRMETKIDCPQRQVATATPTFLESKMIVQSNKVDSFSVSDDCALFVALIQDRIQVLDFQASLSNDTENEAGSRNFVNYIRFIERFNSNDQNTESLQTIITMDELNAIAWQLCRNDLIGGFDIQHHKSDVSQLQDGGTNFLGECRGVFVTRRTAASDRKSTDNTTSRNASYMSVHDLLKIGTGAKDWDSTLIAQIPAIKSEEFFVFSISTDLKLAVAATEEAIHVWYISTAIDADNGQLATWVDSRPYCEDGVHVCIFRENDTGSYTLVEARRGKVKFYEVKLTNVEGNLLKLEVTPCGCTLKIRDLNKYGKLLASSNGHYLITYTQGGIIFSIWDVKACLALEGEIDSSSENWGRVLHYSCSEDATCAFLTQATYLSNDGKRVFGLAINENENDVSVMLFDTEKMRNRKETSGKTDAGVVRVKPHSKTCWSMDTSSDGKYIVTASEDIVKVWDVDRLHKVVVELMSDLQCIFS
jgi:WD40 repeat protein